MYEDYIIMTLEEAVDLYGYQSYSGNIINQIIKDTELLQNNVVKRVEWHFYTSAISNTQGFSKALENALKAAGITIVTHY